MPIPVVNPQNGDDLTAQSITTNVTDKITAWAGSHETGATTNGALRHDSTQIDDAALPETATPTDTAQTQHIRNDQYAVSISALAGGAGVGYAARIAAVQALTYGDITKINTELATAATSAATALRLVRRAADGSANFAATSAFVNITTSGTVVAAGAIQGAAGTFTGIITAGSGAVAITAADGHLNATALTGILPAASQPALTGDVTNAAGSLTTTVATVGAKTAAAIAASVNATTAASATAVGNHGVIAKYDASGGMTFDSTVTAPTFIGALTGTATAVPASGITGTIVAAQIESAIARTANVPTNSGSGATGTWGISISGSAAAVGVGAVGTAGLAAGAVTGAKIAAYTVALSNIFEGAVYPEGGTLRVYVNPLKKWNAANGPVSWAGGYLDMTSHVPGAGLYVYCLISINGAGVAYVKDGTAASGGFSFAAIPNRDPNTTPVGVVALQAGQTSIGALDIIDWRGPNEGAAGGAGGSQVGHDHGLSGEHRVGAVGIDEGFAHPTVSPSMSILMEPLHYRSAAGIGILKPQTSQGGFAVPAGGFYRTYGVYLDPANGSYVNTAFSDTASLPWTYPAFSGNQRAVAYVHLYPASTVIKAGDDGANGWIEDARVFLSGSSPASIPVAVSEGGTGVITMARGTVISPDPGGTTPLTTVPGAASSSTLGYSVAPAVAGMGASADVDLMQLGGGTATTGATNVNSVNGVHFVTPVHSGGGTTLIARTVYVDAPGFGTNAYAGYFNGGLSTTGVTAFPANPATNETCYRRDLGAWFRWDATAWRQVGDAYFTTAARPAAPPTAYRYRDLTDNYTYKWSGTAYQKTSATVQLLSTNQASDVYAAAAAAVTTWTDIALTSSPFTFTVEDANSTLDIEFVFSMSVTLGAAAGGILIAAQIDGTTRYILSSSYAVANGRCAPTGGRLPPLVLSAGAHTIRAQYFATVAATLNYLSNTNGDPGRMIVEERKP